MAEVFWQFFLYSFLGFLLELVFARITRSDKQDRKCLLFLPLCPVYGLGAVLILHLPAAVQRSPLLLYLCAVAVATAVEYGTDWLCERALGVRFWDYSALRWNWNGRVCLVFSLAWGVLAFGLVRVVHPALAGLIAAIPFPITCATAFLTSCDALLTVILLRISGNTKILRWYDRLRPAQGQ